MYGLVRETSNTQISKDIYNKLSAQRKRENGGASLNRIVEKEFSKASLLGIQSRLE